NKKHCEGYMVQQVEMRCNVKRCERKCDGTFDCPTSSPVSHTVTFWEAFHVNEDQPFYDVQERNDTNFTDGSRLPVPPNSCGTVSATGIIRFYCKTDTKDLGVFGKAAPGSGWEIGKLYRKGDCAGHAGQNPATDDSKLVGKFWGKKPVESGYRSHSVFWNC